MKYLLDEMYSPAVAAQCRSLGVDVISVQERAELIGEADDAQVLRAASRARRVLVTNNHRDLMAIVDRFARDGEAHFGVLFTSDRSLPRARATIGLMVRSIVAHAGRTDDDLIDSCEWLRPAT